MDHSRKATAMADASMKTRLVRVHFEADQTGLIFGTSPDLKGLLVAEKTLAEAEQAIPQAIADLYTACGVKVLVEMVDDRSVGTDRSFVAMPAEIAQRALNQAQVN